MQLIGSLSLEDQHPAFSQTLQFNLIVKNDCLTDQVTLQTGITDYIYYLNADTSSPDLI